MRDANYCWRRYNRAKSKKKRKEIKRSFFATLRFIHYMLSEDDFVFCQLNDAVRLRLPNTKVRRVTESILWDLDDCGTERIDFTRVINNTEATCVVCFEEYKIG